MAITWGVESHNAGKEKSKEGNNGVHLDILVVKSMVNRDAGDDVEIEVRSVAHDQYPYAI